MHVVKRTGGVLGGGVTMAVNGRGVCMRLLQRWWSMEEWCFV